MARKSTLVERGSRKGAYDMEQAYCIVDHKDMGRMLLVAGWGGDGLSGESYRYRHGYAYSLAPDATLDGLATTERAKYSWGWRSALLDYLTGSAADESIPTIKGCQIEAMAQG